MLIVIDGLKHSAYIMCVWVKQFHMLVDCFG